MSKLLSVVAVGCLAVVILLVALFAQSQGLLPDFRKDASSDSGDNGLLPNATDVQFQIWELETFTKIKDALIINNTDPTFTGNRTLQFISMRNSSSNDYYQKSMEYLCFWEGQGAAGEWQAIVSMYNLPDNVTCYVVEVSRFTWHSLDVVFNGVVMASFPQVTEDTVSVGYTTFRVNL